jgi:hypothetical protein
MLDGSRYAAGAEATDTPSRHKVEASSGRRRATHPAPPRRPEPTASPCRNRLAPEVGAAWPALRCLTPGAEPPCAWSQAASPHRSRLARRPPYVARLPKPQGGRERG